MSICEVDVVFAILTESLNTLYCVMAEPPVLGAVQLREVCTLESTVPDKSLIAVGTVGVVIDDVALIALVPCVETAFNE